MNKVEKIKRFPLKSVWKNEAHDFTPWLCANMDYLSEQLGFNIINASSELSSDNFRVDIQAELENGSCVVIENQFGLSNHDHLGKIITYRTAFDAKVAIWIVEEARKEHIDACNWLNETDNGCDFYLIRVEVIQIGDSAPAPLFTIEAAPSSESIAIGKIKKEQSERHMKRFEFWSELLKMFKADKEITSFRNVNPTTDSFVSGATGIGGITWTLWLNKDNMRLEVRIDKGKGCDEENIAIFRKLEKHRENIEKEFGGGLNWEEMTGYRLCSIRKDFEGGWAWPKDEWPKIIGTAVDYTRRLIKATKPYIAELK
ncbi:MAG: DUF4268 domain-containing protein [Bacteroidetes bacterium]|uniref:DUF4268 domain-containing protein n=1 Tax=Candidatus Cryptobacteroides merdavium TaxID=2840769 RepID=A0A9D9HC98_9BACT|nr:DUF4268 domain-containing protein [Candidatus Cryptobacteroides merdavium]